MTGILALTMGLLLPASAQEKVLAPRPQGLAPVHVRVIWTVSPESQATVSWTTGQAGARHVVHYDVQPRGGRPEAYASKIDGQKNGRFSGKDPEMYYHHAVLGGLRPSTTYYFVVASDGAASREFHFVTAPAEDVPFRLIFGGDSRSDAQSRRKMNAVMAAAMAKDPGILALCHGGDYISRGTRLLDWNEWLHDHEQAVTPEGRILPVIPARGNHERTGAQYDEVFNTPGAAGKNYFATKIGPELLLVALNTNVSTAGEQAAFLERTLRESAKTRWQLALYHRPAYPAVKSPSSGKEAWVPVFEKFNLDLACEADGHNIKRTVPIRDDKHDPTGVTYIGEGGLGVGQRTPDDDLWYLEAPGKAGKGHHYFLLDVRRDGLRVRVILMDGQVFDDHTLAPRRR